MKHGQLWAGGTLMFQDCFPGLGLLRGCSGAVVAGGGGCGGGCREGLLCMVSCRPWQTRSLSGGKERDPGQRAGWEVRKPLAIQLPSMWCKLIRACTVIRGLTRKPFILHPLHPWGTGQFVGSVWITSPTLCDSTPVHGDPGQAFSRHAQCSSQLSQCRELCRASRDSRSGCQQGWPCQPSPLAAGAAP